MQNVAYNGFKCPYCRTAMANETDDVSTEYPGEENSEEEDDEWETVASEEEADELETVAEDPNIPTTDFVAQKLREQGVTFEQLVHIACNVDHQEYNDNEVAERFSNELFHKIRNIVTDYTPEREAAPEVDFAAQPKTTYYY
jgi:thiol-disulfide isomerase/thioredoxin